MLIPNPRDIGGLIKEMAKYRATMFPAVNTLYNALLHHPDFDKLDWSMLKSAVGGGMAVQKAVADAGQGDGQADHRGLRPVGDLAGADLQPRRHPAWTGTIGYPVPSTDISIRDDDNKEVALGDRGEICARGPQVMPGYWQRADETARVMTADGYFRTGDIGIMDDAGPRHHRRPQEGHDLGVRIQGVPQRGRGRGDDAGRRA